ncbi:hypothetical protein AAVH_42995, partial [Aphelenchoides avenae]
SVSKSKTEATTPSSGSLSFLQKLSFHSKPSPSTPLSPVLHEHSMPVKDQPVDVLVPVPEIDSPTSESASHRTKQHGQDSLSSPGTANETWFETAATEGELFGEVARGDATVTTPTTAQGFSGRWEASASTAAFDRDLEQISLDDLLDDFRSGKMRALSSQQMEAMRDMHREQMELSALHMEIHMRHMDNKLGPADDIEDQYAKVAEKLDHLHELMDRFSSMAPGATV